VLFRAFLRLFNEFDEFFNAVYSSELALLKSNFPKDRSLNIKYTDLEKWNSDIADLLLKNPDKIINAAKEALDHLELKKKKSRIAAWFSSKKEAKKCSR